jgi:hypothetical protein
MFGSESGSMTSSYGSGSFKKFRILTDPDPQHCSVSSKYHDGRRLAIRTVPGEPVVCKFYGHAAVELPRLMGQLPVVMLLVPVQKVKIRYFL